MPHKKHQTPLQVKPNFTGLLRSHLLSNILQQVFDFSVVHDRSLIVATAARLPEAPSTSDVARGARRVFSSLFPNPVQRRLLDRAYYHQAKRYDGIQQHFSAEAIRTPAEFVDFFYAYHAFVAGRTQKAIKSDDIWQHLPALDSVVPNRRYIAIVRDPRDNALSITGKAWGPCELYTAARFVRHQLHIYRREVARDANRAITTKYETLLNHPERFVAEFAEFSGLAPPTDVTRRLQNLKIRSGNCEKWRRLPKKQVAICEAVLANQLEECGYEPSNAGPVSLSQTEVFQVMVKDAAQRVLQRTRRFWRRRVLGS